MCVKQAQGKADMKYFTYVKVELSLAIEISLETEGLPITMISVVRSTHCFCSLTHRHTLKHFRAAY